MKDDDSQAFEVFYTCPRCSKPSLLQVSSSLYKCLLCTPPKGRSNDEIKNSDGFVVFLLLLIGAFLLLTLLQG